ncbi:MAG: hypothetical protein EBX35_14810 [Planctomycetia bacterium]|nr:hypothetical protein [Planctomycetia bacterium]
MTKFVAPHPLSPRQRQLCDVIERLTADRGFPPTLAECATAVKKGWLLREPKVARSWRVTRPDVKADKRS